MHAVDTLTGLLIDLIDNFDIMNIIWMELYIRDWNSTSRYPKSWHIEIGNKRSKLSWKALSLKRDFRKNLNFELTEIDITRFNCTMYTVPYKKYLVKWILGTQISLYSHFVQVNKRLPGACNRSPGSKLLSITMQLHCGGHLGGRAWLPDTILEEDHPMTIPSKFGSNWATGSRQDGFYVNFP